VESSGDVGRRNRNDEVAGRLHLAIWSKIRLEELLLLPPVVPGRFDNLGNSQSLYFEAELSK
jgi:hypothetical protein